MEVFNDIVGAINGVVWGPMMLVLILGVGLFLQLGLRLMPILKLGTGFRLMWSGRQASESDKSSGDISPFQAPQLFRFPPHVRSMLNAIR